ncbi:peptide-methionine (R)-S-oxide reductase MsrB [Flaviflexus equikiangi]|uniref:peptide-methionine (R)-S-oxide reductase n=1 Tax=Flaviflexus equikiangi TaxID=2758573 RepID=A0ABS2TJH1_9ACTO|nr:peptide-methionine (R)-S-oxide reductase MsrB [Flaviflexus equikiangi]MBM9433676.1 peptide-methionine (R)-S-oxide reductase MsrB [Flaviflexus equikiangi]
MTDKNFLTFSESDWRERLDPASYQVLREAGTERPGTGRLLNEGREGTYACKACGTVLFDAGTKFDAHCGWPSFYEAKDGAVSFIEDRTLGMVRTEVRCAACDSHLGHIFPDAPQTPTGNRYCMNSVSLTFVPADGGDVVEG